MLDAASKGRREGFRIRDPGNDTAAPVRLIADLDTVDTDHSLSWVELGGILQVPHPAFVHLLGDPALMADMRVTVPLVERGEYALHLGRAVTCDRQPGALGVRLIEVRFAVRGADLRQAGTPRLEAQQG